MNRQFYALAEWAKDEIIFLYIDDDERFGSTLSTLSGLSPCGGKRVYRCTEINKAQFQTYRAFGIPEYTPSLEELHFATHD